MLWILDEKAAAAVNESAGTLDALELIPPWRETVAGVVVVAVLCGAAGAGRPVA